MVLLCNKSDLLESKGAAEGFITPKDLETFGVQQGFFGTAYTSAMTGKGVGEGFALLFKEVLKRKSATSATAKGIKLDAKSESGKKKGKCC